ncbi:hypothetical protein PENCOP_c006G08613 [Penicillium coprophilum]|uniref:DUF6604 domain-containing protein n=1 Tax=Penicillium coprophilum TaxID=36646 RepID=A0A1V6UPC5_9EURO|nr:hypothetical protein PENCOP_c006G08613 [Penicillium coprophilum]
MADHNTYLKYTRDERYLVYWIFYAFAHITRNFPSSRTEGSSLTGAISLHFSFICVSNHLRLYLQSTASEPDPESQKRNVSRQDWIERLSEAFNILEGKAWQEGKEEILNTSDTFDEDQDHVIFANTFSMLSLNDQTDDGGEGDADADGVGGEDANTSLAAIHQKTKYPQEISLESCRIIEDQTGMTTNYLMAVYSITEQLVRLRHELQGTWYSVAYHGMNTAIASSLCKVAIRTIKHSQLQIFIDFPGYDSFDTIMQTMLRGDRNFITDYQKTRSGKSTKAMLKSIQHWNPLLLNILANSRTTPANTMPPVDYSKRDNMGTESDSGLGTNSTAHPQVSQPTVPPSAPRTSSPTASNRIPSSLIDTVNAMLVRCKGDYGSLWRIVTIPSNHAIFNNPVPPVPALLDFPIVVHQLGLFNTGIPGCLDNQSITYIHIDPKTGFAPPEWQSGVGSVIVARKDKKDLPLEHYETIWMYCDRILDYSGNGIGEPECWYNRKEFERWFASYQRNEVRNGRREWVSVPPLYEE